VPTILGFYHHPRLSWQQLSEHWRLIYSALIASTVAVKKYLKCYVQLHVWPEQDFGDELALDFGDFSEPRYESADARKAMRADLLRQELIGPDDHRLLDSRTRKMMYDLPMVQIGTVQRLASVAIIAPEQS
jgi:hypothetical protein